MEKYSNQTQEYISNSNILDYGLLHFLVPVWIELKRNKADSDSESNSAKLNWCILLSSENDIDSLQYFRNHSIWSDFQCERGKS